VTWARQCQVTGVKPVSAADTVLTPAVAYNEFRNAAASQRGLSHAGRGQLLHAEWTKFRTVRGWVAGMIVAGLLIIAVNLIPGGECGGLQSGGQVTLGGPGCALMLGPGRRGGDRQLLFRA
jgi:hypothetical protein